LQQCRRHHLDNALIELRQSRERRIVLPFRTGHL